jgi:hypothetical protein
MRRNTLPTYTHPLILLGLYALLSTAAYAQVSFVQISDPHVFDDATQTIDNRLDDYTALASCVDKINQRISDNGAPYDFVAVTGDLGIEKLVEGVDPANNDLIGIRIRSAAAGLASVLALSDVKRWLFVPGNNDVANEELGEIKYYHLFLEALADEVRKRSANFEIVDLCPRGSAAGERPDSRPFLYQIKEKPKYAFIGFDDSTFKNDPTKPAKGVDGKRIEANSELQKRHVEQVFDLLRGTNSTYAYIFYHIPEIDDPYLATQGNEEKTIAARLTDEGMLGGPYSRSAWFVTANVRTEWRKVVTNPKVYGLFAGHFHDPRRNTYLNLDWLPSPNTYPSESRTKLHVCPPLALKFQNLSSERARGFREVYINEAGAVSTGVFWLDGGGWDPGAETMDAEAASLELGRTYERLDRLKEAESSYAKAADAKWSPTRRRALDSLGQVIERQDTFFEKYLRAPLSAGWVAGMTAAGKVLLTVALIILLGVPYYYFAKWRGERAGREQLKIGPIVVSPKGQAGVSFEQVAAMMHGRMRVHYKRRGPLFGPQTKLPMLAKSQSAEVGTLIEAVVPGGLGKLIAWLHLKNDRPKYSIEGVVQSDSSGQHAIFISLSDAGEPLNSWSASGHSPRAVVMLYKRLARRSLRRLVRHMNP